MKMKNLLLTVLAILGFAFTTLAQITYCSPTFANGCTNWRNQAVTLDSIQWTIGSTTCTISDYTALHTTLTAGVAMPMSVMNGDWCGVGVWIDFNLDGNFDDTENLYFLYNALAGQTYNFNITVPVSVANGMYRMRVIAGWGTDCYNVSSNGYGGCGSYQYGNFDDFTVYVIGSAVGIKENQNTEKANFSLSPNPVLDQLKVHLNSGLVNSTYTLLDPSGKMVMEGKLNSENSNIEMGTLPAGIYFFSLAGNPGQTVKLIRK
jgi:hypothetical protein